EAFLNYPECSGAFARAHRLDVNFIIRPDHGDLVTALQFGNRLLRDQHRAAGEVEFHADAPQPPRSQLGIWIWKKSGDSEGARRWANLPIGCVDSPFERIDLAIDQD